MLCYPKSFFVALTGNDRLGLDMRGGPDNRPFTHQQLNSSTGENTKSH